uniref:OTU domain-containing protein n=1 Tax=Globodera pallida TaxID=36090 RepID=A0A183C000_GLOPA
MSAENLLLELVELWSKYNSQNWQNRQECAHRDKSSQAKMERQGSESRQLLNHDYARKRGQESKKRSHPESIEKGTEKAGAQLEIQNITSDQLSKITVVSGDITKQKAKRQIVPSRPSTPKTSATSEPSTSQSPPRAPLARAVIDKPTPIVEQTIRQTVSCVNVKGDGDCFYRAICYGLFRVDSMENSDALRKASGRILRAILENTNFFPRKRHRSHADFTHALSQLLLPSPSDLWYNKTLEAYSQFIENPARDGIGIWAQLDDAHTIAILLQRPVGMTRNIPHVQLNSFTVQERTLEYVLVERTVVNPIVIWYDGIDHYQSIIFDPMAPNASAGSEYIFAQNFDIPEDFLHGNVAPQQQHSPGQTQRNENNVDQPQPSDVFYGDAEYNE